MDAIKDALTRRIMELFLAEKRAASTARSGWKNRVHAEFEDVNVSGDCLCVSACGCDMCCAGTAKMTRKELELVYGEVPDDDWDALDVDGVS